MRIAIDGTSAATQSAGVGRYTREILRALLQQEHGDTYEILCATSSEQARRLEDTMPPGQWRSIRSLPVSDRLLTALWHRLHVPLPVDVLLSDFDVYHGPDFVLPPTRRASVVTVHDLSFLIHPDLGEPSLVRYLTSAVPRALSRADQIITVSASVAAELVDAYPFARAKVRAIPNGVAKPLVTEAHDASVSDTPVILIVGTIEPRKNHLTALNVARLVREQIPGARLVIAGRVGWRSGAIMSRIRGESAGPAVSWVDSPTDFELERLYRQADVFLYPSLYEGFGLPVLEAMRHGLPVVASDVAALKETAAGAALHAPPDDAASLAHHVCTLLTDQQVRATLIDAGHQRVASHTWEAAARRTRQAYQAALEAHSRG